MVRVERELLHPDGRADGRGPHSRDGVEGARREQDGARQLGGRGGEELTRFWQWFRMVKTIVEGMVEGTVDGLGSGEGWFGVVVVVVEHIHGR